MKYHIISATRLNCSFSGSTPASRPLLIYFYRPIDSIIHRSAIEISAPYYYYPASVFAIYSDSLRSRMHQSNDTRFKFKVLSPTEPFSNSTGNNARTRLDPQNHRCAAINNRTPKNPLNTTGAIGNPSLVASSRLSESGDSGPGIIPRLKFHRPCEICKRWRYS